MLQHTPIIKIYTTTIHLKDVFDKLSYWEKINEHSFYSSELCRYLNFILTRKKDISILALDNKVSIEQF